MEYDLTPIYTILFWLILGFLIYLFLFARAISAQVIISEVYPAPPTGENEWVELYNAGAEPADLSDWVLEDQLSTPSVLKQWTNETIEPLSFLVIELTSAKLNNAADGVTLKNETGAVVDTMGYTSSQLGKSWSLIAGQWLLTEPTKGSTNPPPPSPSPSPTPSTIPSPSPTSYPTSALSLRTIMACPNTGEPEWVEVFNSSEQTISLAGWKLLDDASIIATLKEHEIQPHKTLKIELSSARLNNTGDSVILEAPNGVIAFEESYTTCAKGIPLIKVGATWVPTGSASDTTSTTTSTAPSSVTSTLDGSSPTTLGWQTSSQLPDSSTHLPLGLASYSPKLDTPILSGVPDLPPLNLAAPTPDIVGATSAIIGGLLIAVSNGFYVFTKLSHAHNLP